KSFSPKYSKSIIPLKTELDDFVNIEIIENGSFDIIYVIDIHCSFWINGEFRKLQQQGGVLIYRYLLNLYQKENIIDKPKVIFYSPVCKNNLVKLKPENYVLKLLPFVQLKFEKDGQFAKE